MATGWAPDGAVQDRIDDTVTDAVARARANMPQGESEPFCVEWRRGHPRGAAAGAARRSVLHRVPVRA